MSPGWPILPIKFKTTGLDLDISRIIISIAATIAMFPNIVRN